MLSVPTMRLGNRLIIDPRPAGPIIVAWLFAMLILGAENDIGFTLMVFVLFIVMLWVASGRLAWLVVGLVMFAVGAFIASHLFPQVNSRITDWIDPWSPANYNRINGSFQIAQSQYSFGNGGLLGTGLGYGFWGSPPLFTNGELATDFIFIVFGQEMGLIGTSVIVAAFLLVVGAGLQIAQKARSEFSKLAATGLTAILGLQAFIIMAGLVRLLPLTGITLPFMAYGGSSLVANYIIVALLMRISDEGNRSIIAAEATATRVRVDEPRPLRSPAISGSGSSKTQVATTIGTSIRWRSTSAMPSEGLHGTTARPAGPIVSSSAKNTPLWRAVIRRAATSTR